MLMLYGAMLEYVRNLFKKVAQTQVIKLVNDRICIINYYGLCRLGIQILIYIISANRMSVQTGF